ncbi:hypothetical protein C9J48_05870 [Photobacterium profundum]|uniref:Uncharacterized protein n=1 Tax=Photobacterium profundum 3TCK TaxID=314280 RepID=Q1Z9I5_9GAMM|nr:hypothetical protein [Photobacterium profundum]EAS45857.1 hypothetical protein P3TCK_05751 [Photobacterium profundum 3TCK]PSV63020.1 hypothetical protein C9J48_05870 [Photobacterium profundum]
MSKLHIGQVKSSCERFMKTMQLGDVFEVLTFKKDRGFRVAKSTNDKFEIMQFGYIEKVIIGDVAEVGKVIKKALKVEFPRSNMAWIYHHNNVESTNDIVPDPQYSLF